VSESENIVAETAEKIFADLADTQTINRDKKGAWKAPLWQAMVSKYNLLDYTFEQAAAWPFGEAVFNIEYDVMADTTKCRQFGFYEFVDTQEMLLRLLGQFRQMRFIPS